MEFETFLSLCGGSLLAEEYKGDFDAAYDYLQQVEYDKLPDLDNKAEYLRCSSIYAILTGNFANAYDYLGSLHTLLDQLSPEWGLRYTNYKVLADYTRRFPPMLRFHHEQGWPLNMSMLGGITGPNDTSQSFLKNVNTYLPQGLPRDQALCQILNVVSWFPINSRHMTTHFHPLSPGGAHYTPNENPSPVIEQTAKNFLGFRAIAETNGASSMANYLSRLVVELYIACESAEKDIMLQDLYQRCEKSNDYVGMANAKLLEGDSALCAPFTSPLALNLVTFNTSAAVGDHNFWDPIEFDLPFDYSDTAKGCYESAFDLFKASGCKRGQAAVLFRQGCCLHTLARLQRKSDKGYTDLLVEAESKLQDAAQLFGRDEANVQFVKAHQILLAISKRNPQRVKKLARDIGNWCAAAKNEILAHVLGLIMTRFAYQEWHLYSNLDTAQQAWECVYEICRAVDDIIPLFQSVASRASVHHEMFNAPASQLLIGEAFANIEEVREYVRDKIQFAPKTPLGQAELKLLQTTKCTLLWTFGRLVGSIYTRAENTTAYLEWHARLSDWMENDEDFHDWRERLDDVAYLLPKDFKAATTVPEHKQGSLWKKVLADDAANVRYSAAESKFRRLLEEGDVLGAEDVLKRFVDENEREEKVYTRDLYRILACDRIGDRAKARAIMDTISDDELFDGNLNSYQQGIGVRSSLPTVGQNALSFALFAGDTERGRRLVQMISGMNPAFFDSVIDNSLDWSIRLCHYAALMRETEPEFCFTRLLIARQVIETRRRQTTDIDARVWSSTAGWIGEVYLNLARICLRAGDLWLPLQILASRSRSDLHIEGMSWMDHALVFVEMYRARSVLESLQTQASQTTGVSEAPNAKRLSEAVHKRRLLRSLLSLETLTNDQEKEVSQLREDIQDLEDDGTLSYATNFIETVNSTVEPRLLYQNIDEDAVVIEATFGSRGTVAFAVTKDGIKQVHQSSFCQVDMRRPVMRSMQILRELTGYISDQEEKQKNLLNELCNEISDHLLVPFADIIRTKSHIIFSVSDPLTAFPFSILPFDGKPLIMQAVVSQVPSLTVLYYLSQRKSASASPTVSVLAKSPTEEPSSTTRGGKEANLHMAGIEAVNIARMFATWPIEASQVTRKDFQQYVEGGSLIMHIGTHGDINYRNPLLSSISIGQGQEFRVVDMSAIKSNVNLLVFAACLSGFGKATIGSEVLGFSHVVLSTGCQAYIGSLWKVSDFGSMLIMTLFYQHLKANPYRPVAEAMRAAQMGLLQLDTDKATALLDQIVESWSSSGNMGQNPAEFVPDAEFLLLTMKMILAQLDWSSPFYWAPFTLVGYGGFRFLHEQDDQQDALSD